MTSKQLREWVTRIDELKARYCATYWEELSDVQPLSRLEREIEERLSEHREELSGEELGDAPALRRSMIRHFAEQFINQGMTESQAIQRAIAHVNSPEYRPHFNYVRKRLCEERTKAREGRI